MSALELEEVLRTHSAIAECAVVGVEDADWGERVCAFVQLRHGMRLTLDELQEWSKLYLASYKVPKTLRFVSVLPRNAMGKVAKPQLKALMSPSSPPADSNRS